MSGPEERIMESMVEAFPYEASDEATACPDANVLNAFIEGRVPDDTRAALEPHIATCPICQAVVGSVAADMPEPALPLERTASRIRWPRFAAAAALVVGIGAGIFALTDDRIREPGIRPTPDARLVAAAEELRMTSADLFAAFEPLDPEERATRDGPLMRGGVRLYGPAHRVVSRRPDFAWQAVPGARDYELAVLDATGMPLWSERAGAPKLAWPEARTALEPGSYVWRVRTEGALGEVTGRRAFEVVDDAGAARVDAARTQVVERVDPDLALVLFAHWAVRGGFFVEAEQALRDHLDRYPTDDVGRETLRYVLHALGEVSSR